MGYKECSICNERKLLSEFYSYNKVNAKGEDYTYYHPECKKCAIKKARKWYIENPEQVDKSRKKYFQSKKFKKWMKKNNEEMKDNQAEWRKNNPDKCKKYNKKRNQHKKHDITEEELKQIYEYADYSCMYCGISEKEAKKRYKQKLHKDHAYNDGANDITNCILACKSCNSSKYKSDWDIWYTPDNEIYNEERYYKIKIWLNKF